jgi:nitrite reductase/ring-hydroxylating ferredoxin subunit
MAFPPARTALFQRKGSPLPAAKPAAGVVISIGHKPPHDEGAEGEASTVECKNCGATIDTQTGDVVDKPDAAGPPAGPGAEGSPLGDKLKAMMGGG